MYHPYIRQKLFEAQAWELERIAEEDRAAQAHAADAPIRRFDWPRLGLGRRRVAVPRSVRSDAGGLPGDG
jgi:hypothetical protein